MTLKGKRILLGMTGGIAAYKAAELVRLLKKEGAEVRVAMTEAATRFVTPVTLQALSGQTVWTDLWDPRIADNMGHIELSRDREIIVVAPASADFMAKLAAGLADDLLSTLCLARRCPLMVVPAMNVEMWEHPATQRNVATLYEDDVLFAGPSAGDQACGETGFGRMLEPAEIVDELEAFFQPKRLAGKRILVTAGPTEEPVDPVRMLTNASSGKMGYAVARAAREAGGEVTLVSGPVALPTPAGVARVNVRTARTQMVEAGYLAGVEAFRRTDFEAATAELRPMVARLPFSVSHWRRSEERLDPSSIRILREGVTSGGKIEHGRLDVVGRISVHP